MGLVAREYVADFWLVVIRHLLFAAKVTIFSLGIKKGIDNSMRHCSFLIFLSFLRGRYQVTNACVFQGQVRRFLLMRVEGTI